MCVTEGQRIIRRWRWKLELGEVLGKLFSSSESPCIQRLRQLLKSHQILKSLNPSNCFSHRIRSFMWKNPVLVAASWTWEGARTHTLVSPEFHVIYTGKQVQRVNLLEIMRGARCQRDFLQVQVSLAALQLDASFSSLCRCCANTVLCVGQVVIRSDPLWWGDSRTANVVVVVSPNTSNTSSCCDVQSQCFC